MDNEWASSHSHHTLSLCAHTPYIHRSLALASLSLPANPWRSSHRKSHDITLLIYFAPRTMACVCRLPNYCYYHRLHAATGRGKIRAGAHMRKSAFSMPMVHGIYGPETISRKHTLQTIYECTASERERLRAFHLMERQQQQHMRALLLSHRGMGRIPRFIYERHFNYWESIRR
jgi:hypothetical protein